jgi:hypothetical protein
MTYIGLLQLFGIVFVVMSLWGFGTSWKFFKLRDVVWLKTADMREVMMIFSNMSKLENPEEHLARLARMSPCDVKYEIAQGNMIGVVSTICGNVLRDLEASAPESAGLTQKIKDRLKI